MRQVKWVTMRTFFWEMCAAFFKVQHGGGYGQGGRRWTWRWTRRWMRRWPRRWTRRWTNRMNRKVRIIDAATGVVGSWYSVVLWVLCYNRSGHSASFFSPVSLHIKIDSLPGLSSSSQAPITSRTIYIALGKLSKMFENIQNILKHQMDQYDHIHHDHHNRPNYFKL